MLEDAQGYLWFGTHRGLSRFDGKNFLNYEVGDKPEQLSGSFVSGLASASDGSLWIATEKGIDKFDGRIFHRANPATAPENVRNALLKENPTQAFIDQRTIAQQVAREVQIHCAAYDKEGHLWLGTENGAYHLTPDFLWGKTKPVIGYSVRSCLCDHEGNMWFGTEGSGVCKVSEGVFQSYTVTDGLASNIAKSFIEDAQGNVWIASSDKGVSRPEGETFRTLTDRDGLGGNDICYSFRDGRGNFWFCSYSSGITRLNPRNPRGDHYTYTPFDELPSSSVYCGAALPNGEIWVGTSAGIGIIGGKKPDTLLPSQPIYCITPLSESEVWIGTPDGVFIWKNGEIVPQPNLRYRNVLTILPYNDSHLWIATASGLQLFDRKTRLNRQIQLEEGNVAANTIVSLVADSHQNLWIGTENGIYRLWIPSVWERKQPVTEHFSAAEGVPSKECNANAAYCDSRGNIWFGTIEGAVKYASQGVAHGEKPIFAPDTLPIVHITEVRLSMQPTDWEAMGYALNTLSHLPQQLLLSYSDNRLGFSFIGISYRNTEDIVYRYKLEGIDADWSPPTKDTRTAYSHLPPGKYTFWVQAAHQGQAWSNPQSFSFQIKPPFWRTWWFIGLMVLVVALVGWLIYAEINNRIEQRRREQQMQFQAEKVQLEHQALYAMMNPHFTFNALQSIQYFIHRQDKIAANKFLASFAKLMRKNLDSLNQEFISLAEEIERLNLYLSLEKMRFQDKFTYTIEVDDSLNTNEIQVPPMIFQPYVENSIKHGIMPLEEREGSIVVRIEPADDDHLRVTLTDNGIGITASKARRENRPSDHVSRGMKITQDRLALFANLTGKKHSLDIRELFAPDGVSAGTQVEMILPLKE